MVEGTEGSHHKEGSTKMSKDITVCAGIDIGKHKLDKLTEDVGKLKTRREASREQRIREFWKREINRLKVLLNSELKQLVAVIREHRDLAHRLDLIASVDGVGLRTAVAILVRMP